MPASCWSRSIASDLDRPSRYARRVLLADLVAVSERVSSTGSRAKKIDLLADTLNRLSPDEAPAAVSFLAGRPRQSRLNVGYATVYAVDAQAAAEPSLSVLEVDEASNP